MEHYFRLVYQWYKWTLPLRFMRKTTQLEIMYDRKTIQLASKFLHANSTIVDVGANNGSILSRLVKIAPHGRHIAFEPIPFFTKYLHEKYPTVDVRGIAISSKPGIVNFFNTYQSPALSSLNLERIKSIDLPFKSIEVRTNTLDNELQEFTSVEFIKIDVEGHELEVLMGAQSILTKFLPILVIEVGKNTEASIRKFLSQFDYEVTYLLEENDFLSSKLPFEILDQGSRLGIGYIKAIPFKPFPTN